MQFMAEPLQLGEYGDVREGGRRKEFMRRFWPLTGLAWGIWGVLWLLPAWSADGVRANTRG